LKLADPVIAAVAITGGLLNTKILETDLLTLEQAPAQPNLETFFGISDQGVQYEFHAFAEPAQPGPDYTNPPAVEK
jgi:hypothetical protein